jgi:ribosomal 50S subunit-recycling heat shock protein
MRLDLFLKQSRLITRRTLAQEACAAGLILLNGIPAKPGKNVRAGDLIEWRQRSRKILCRITKIPRIPPARCEASTLYKLIRTEQLPEAFE